MRLPAEAAQFKTFVPAAAPVTLPQGNSALIIDDDPLTQILMSRLIEKEGLQPVAAADGETGLRWPGSCYRG